jgi:PAS domain S-box-containing protein
MIEQDQLTLGRLCRGESVEPYETVRVTKSRGRVDISLTISPVRDAAGRIIGVSRIARDITERKHIQQELFESRERLRMAMEASQMGTWTRKLDETNRVEWSPEMERIFGLNPGEFPGTEEAFFDHVHPDDRGQVSQAVRDAIETRTDYEVEFRYMRKGEGQPCQRWMIGRGRAFYDDAGRPFRLAGLGWDITERKRAEEDRLQLLASERAARERAEAASRSKDEFVAMISHEIRSPLNAILGWAQMLRTGKCDQAETTRALETIERNAKTQVQLVDDLLDVSRVITGKLNLKVRPVEPTQIIQAALDSIRPAADAKSIQIHVRLEPKGSLVSGDPDRLQQIFWNLLSNAVKFTPRYGRIEVTAERLNSHLQITVSDSGTGIRPDFLPYVFDRFSQANITTQRKFGGLGLGLAIVRHLVELHGGAVHAESPGEGKGATFTVTLPVRAVRQERCAFEPTDTTVGLTTSTDGIMLDNLPVMIVDDEAETRELLTAMLTQRRAEVKACASAAEALRAIERWRPSVLLCDIGMPDEDGYALIRRLRALEPERGGNIPAVALTAYARAEDRMRALASGFQMHVPKPVETLELIMVIASLAGRKTPSG